MVSIPACHAGDPGSIPGIGALLNPHLSTAVVATLFYKHDVLQLICLILVQQGSFELDLEEEHVVIALKHVPDLGIVVGDLDGRFLFKPRRVLQYHFGDQSREQARLRAADVG